MSAAPPESALARARAFLDQEIRPLAGRIDRDPEALRQAADALAAQGLMGQRIAPRFGGLGLPTLTARRIGEATARASGALAFLDTQHQSACGMLDRFAPEPLRQRLLPGLARGALRSGIAFSHLRRPGPPLLRAEPCDGGWTLHGHAPWVTGWSFFTHCVSAALLPDGAVLFAAHRLEGSDALRPSAPMALCAFEVANTVRLDFEGLFVPESDRVVQAPADWIRANDGAKVAAQAAFALGCAGAGVDLLREAAARRGEAATARAAATLDEALSACRTECYAAMQDEGDGDRGLRARAEAIALMGRCAHAAIAAWAGSANLADHPAQRVWREALMFTVLSQSPAVRAASLERLAQG